MGKSLNILCPFGLRQGEKRPDIQLNSFGFYTNGSLEVDLSFLRVSHKETKENIPLVRGFEGFVGGRGGAQVSEPHPSSLVLNSHPSSASHSA